MTSFHPDESILFILGAGFCIDAASEAGNPIGIQRPAKYPLVSELLKACFNKDFLPSNKSIEDLFQKSVDEGNEEPIKILYETLMEADFFIAPHLMMGGSHSDNVYMRFLDDFPLSPLITFNYDSLPEILLLSKKAWRPDDGYGVPVKVKPRLQSKNDLASFPDKSSRVILHLHGTFCVYAHEYDIEFDSDSIYGELREREQPKFIFDSDTIGQRFGPFERVYPTNNFRYPNERIIAPIPDKTEGLKNKFIKEVYKLAINFIRNSSKIVVIGYSFNINDLSSYKQLLENSSKNQILVVSPNAKHLVERMRHTYPQTQWDWENMSFKDWVSENYPGIT